MWCVEFFFSFDEIASACLLFISEECEKYLQERCQIDKPLKNTKQEREKREASSCENKR